MNLEDKYFIRIKDLLLAQRDDYEEIYLVGGFVRDTILNKLNKDLDFAVIKNAAKAARTIADNFGGNFYLLDQQRETARALVTFENQKMNVDIAIINGENIIEDLKKRDFSINAMAIDLANLEKIIDPLGGKIDLQQHQLKPCSDNSFLDDPVRTLRAIRFIQSLSLNYDPQVKHAILNASRNLICVSGERIREELCQIFTLSEVIKPLQLMVEFDLFKQLFPDLVQLRDLPPRLPHVYDAFTHTIRVVELTQLFIESMVNPNKKFEDKFPNDVISIIKKYDLDLLNCLTELAGKNISIFPLIIMAALYHDSGKSFITPIEENGKTIFPKHAEKSAAIIYERMKILAFSNDEIYFSKLIVRHHMSEKFKTIGNEENPNRSIYRFFQETGYSGVITGFLHLADIIATYEDSLSGDRWSIALKSVEKILDGWFNHFNDVVSPPRLLDGNDLIEKFDLKPGRELGNILERIYEEQAAGTILERDDAIAYAEKMILESSK